MKKIILKIEGMSCSACSNGLEKYLNKQDGIISCSVNLVSASARIEYEDKLKIEDLNRFVSEAGFKSLGEYNINLENKKDNSKIYLYVYAFLAILLMYVSMGHMIKLPVIPFLDMEEYPINYALSLLILTIPFLIYGFDIFKSGYKNLIHKTPNMDTLVTIGVFSNFLYSLYNFIMILLGNISHVHSLYFESSAIIIFFIKLGRFVDRKSKEKTNDAIKELVQITPQTALLKTKNGEKEVTIDEVKKGDILISKPGMKIAVDGIITKGSTHTDEAFITGESIPYKRKINDRVIAGSINIDGYIEYKAEKIGKNSTISEIVRLVVEATNTKAPISLLADKVCGYFVPTIILIAIFSLIINLILNNQLEIAISSFVSVLVVSCPCALGLATPLAIIISEGVCAKKGILVKNSEVLENSSKIDTIVFDKTGTLTYGELKISEIYNYSKYSKNEIIQIVSSLENNSSHPIANAFKMENKLEIKDVVEFENLSGIGIKGKIKNKEYYIGNNKLFNKLNIKNEHIEDEEKLINDANSIVYVIENNKVLALIGVRDIVRKNIKQLINSLEKMNKEIIMLTGDNEKSAKIIASSIGIKNVMAELLPAKKQEIIKNLINEGKKVMMVGDGINDAASLATSTVGVSISSGTDIASNSSNVILMNDNLERIVDLLNISHKTFINIKENLFWAFFYNILMIPVALGLYKNIGISLNPMLASLSMTLSSICVLLNALRLRKLN